MMAGNDKGGYPNDEDGGGIAPLLLFLPLLAIDIIGISQKNPITIDSSENTPLDLVADSYDNNAASNLTIFGRF